LSFQNSDAALVLVVLLTAVLYAAGSRRAPMYVGSDEAYFGLNAASLAATGRDLGGTPFPLFFNLRDPLDGANTRRWYQPPLFYAIAAALTVLPFSETAIRLPSAIVGLFDVLLIYALGRRAFGDRAAAAIAALLLALSPAQLIMSRQAADYAWSIPFVLGWLWCVLAAVQTRRRRFSIAAGLLLGLGIYSYIGAWILMPILLVLTLIAQLRAGLGTKTLVSATLAFSAPALVGLTWLARHSQMLSDTVSRYQITAPRLDRLQHAVATYWDYFDPSFLFMTGGAAATTATGRTGVFLIGVGILIAIGVYRWTHTRDLATSLALAGFVVTPLAATVAGEPYMIQRAMPMIPFGILLAAAGALDVRRQRRRGLEWLVIALVVLQFGYFARDYFNHYAFRSGAYFDSADFRTLTDRAIAADAQRRAPVVYISRRFDDGGVRWLFHLTTRQRRDLFDRSRYFDGDGLDTADAERDSLMLFYANGPPIEGVIGGGRWIVLDTIVESSSGARSMLLRKVR
jgi:4-amino-4-deoxy-L-arabinose transferase-like glycosyltransferase